MGSGIEPQRIVYCDVRCAQSFRAARDAGQQFDSRNGHNDQPEEQQHVEPDHPGRQLKLYGNVGIADSGQQRFVDSNRDSYGWTRQRDNVFRTKPDGKPGSRCVRGSRQQGPLYRSNRYQPSGGKLMELRRRHISSESRTHGISKLIFVVLLVAMFAAAVPAYADGLDLAYQPMRAEWNLQPGQIQTATVQIKNQGQVDVHLRARIMDFYVSQDNTPQFVESADNGYSCRSWLVLNPSELDVDAGSVETFRYTLRAPAQISIAARTFRCALAFESMPTLADRLQKKSFNQVRLVTVIYATIGTPQAIPSIGTPSLDRKDWTLSIPFANSGETHYRLEGKIVIADEQSHDVQTLEMDSSPIHPGTNVDIRFPMKKLTPGNYVMTLQVRLGNKILEKEALLEIPPDSLR
jgi:hypothetical protein